MVHAVFDLEPVRVDSDYELAFQHVRGTKRAFVLVLTDLLEESAARPLVDALPVVAVRHAVTVAGAADADLEAAVAASRSCRPTSTAPLSRSTCSMRVHVSPPVCGVRAPTSSRRIRSARHSVRQRVSQGEVDGALLAQPRQITSPQKSAPSAGPDADHRAEPGLGEVRAVPFDDAATTSHGAVPTARSTARFASSWSACARGR